MVVEPDEDGVTERGREMQEPHISLFSQDDADLEAEEEEKAWLVPHVHSGLEKRSVAFRESTCQP